MSRIKFNAPNGGTTTKRFHIHSTMKLSARDSIDLDIESGRADTHLFMQFLDPSLRTLKTVLILYIIDDDGGLRSPIIHGS